MENRSIIRELMEKANAMNPQFRPICGFQPAFDVDADGLQIVLADSSKSDHFDLIYATKEVEIYQLDTLVSPGRIRLYDTKLIAGLIGYESWIIVQGLLAVNREDQLAWQLKRAKRELIQAIDKIWGIDLMKKEA